MKKPTWYIASLIFRFRPSDPGFDDHEDCYGLENWYLFQGEDEDEIVYKAAKMAKEECDIHSTRSDGAVGYFECLGIGDLLPVYDEIEDGCEVLWAEYEEETLVNLESRVGRKLS